MDLKMWFDNRGLSSFSFYWCETKPRWRWYNVLLLGHLFKCSLNRKYHWKEIENHSYKLERHSMASESTYETTFKFTERRLCYLWYGFVPQPRLLLLWTPGPPPPRSHLKAGEARCTACLLCTGGVWSYPAACTAPRFIYTQIRYKKCEVPNRDYHLHLSECWAVLTL